MSRMSLPDRFGSWLADDCGVPAGAAVVAGVSGGLDSMVMLDLLKRTDLKLKVTHVNYRLRETDSDADAALVAETCERMGLPCRVIQLDPDWSGRTKGESLQERARDIRYEILEQEAGQSGAAFVAVAHHLDDQVETILLRMIRGSGLRGLAGMMPSRPISDESDIRLVRPLLFARRSELESYAEAIRLPYRHDRSNSDLQFDRAKIRHLVLRPLVEAFGETSLEAVARTAAQAQSVLKSVVHDRLVQDLENVRIDGEEASLDIGKLSSFDPGWRQMLLLEAVSRWAPDAPQRTSTVDRLNALLNAQTGKRAEFGRTQVWRDRDRLVFTSGREGAGRAENREIDFVSGHPVRLESGEFAVGGPFDVDTREIEQAKAVSRDSSLVEIADVRMLERPVTIGKWRQGERFRPMGMDGHKTVGEFLTDRKVPAHQKDGALVVRSGGEVVWVVGHRLAHPFRVTSATRRAVILRFEPRPKLPKLPGQVGDPESSSSI